MRKRSNGTLIKYTFCCKCVENRVKKNGSCRGYEKFKIAFMEIDILNI